ncbi:hypothetical protein [Tenacibaculum sp. 190524A02b]|uniref:hypothetical protein n=1 Tax=Tenacibaculum vairaonense TaxID=3137860 RepID=UPI0031FA84FA
MKTKELIILCIGILIGCQRKSDKIETFVFSPPQIINSQLKDTIKSIPFKASFVSEVFPRFVGKFKFQDRIDINPEKRDSLTNKDFINLDYKNSLSDSIDVNGLELIVDYKNTVRYNPPYYERDSILLNYYPVYFVNSTNSDKLFYGKDNYVFGIQEAISKEKYGSWLPIESRGFDFCGNGHWGLVVHPQEFILVLMRKYEGSFNTQMRVRFKVNENIFVSKSFKGSINESQFSIRDSSYLKSRLQKTNGKATSWLFYGAVPKEKE